MSEILDPVPRLFPGRTVFIVASGSSVRDVEVDAFRPYPTIVVNRGFELCPWADVLYFSDGRFFNWHKQQILAFNGMKICGDHHRRRYGDHPAIRAIKHSGRIGLDERPTRYRGGNGSGYAAINVAVHLGAAEIVLVGYDLHGERWHGGHVNEHGQAVASNPRALEKMRPHFASLVEPLTRLGVRVTNATDGSALTCFPRVPLDEVLTRVVEEEEPLREVV